MRTASRRTSPSVTTYLHHDAIGSTRVLTEASGAASATLSYAAYGALTGSTGTARTPFGFAAGWRLRFRVAEELRVFERVEWEEGEEWLHAWLEGGHLHVACAPRSLRRALALVRDTLER